MKTLLRCCGALFALTAFVALVALATQVRGTEAGDIDYIMDGTVPIAWTDISGTGALLAGISDDDDDYQSNVPIGFTFHFAGTDYTVLEPTSNGVISLDQEGNDAYDSEPLASNEYTGAALFPWWDDLDTSIDGLVYAQTLGTAPNRAFVIQYDGISHNNSSEPGFGITFQAVLCEGSNNIVFQYLDAVFADPSYPDNDHGRDATIGIKDDNFSVWQYSFLSPAITDGLAIVFYPTSGSATNCLGSPAPTTTTTTTETNTPPSGPAPTSQPSTTLVAAALPVAGTNPPSAGSANGWLIVALAGTGAAALLGFGALQIRGRRT